MINKKAITYLEALFAVVVWGANFVATKDVVGEISPVTIIWLRFGMGFLILGAATAWRKQFSLPQKSEWAYLALLGFIGITFHQWLQATGLITAAATTTAWIVATIPIFTAILGWLVLREKLGWLAIVGIVLATFGVLLIVSKGNLSALAAGNFGTPGDFLVLISAVNWAVFSVLSRRGLASQPAARMMFYVMFFGWLFTSLWLFGFGPGLSEIPQLSTRGWGNILVLGIFGSGLAYIAWFDALREIPASRLSAFIYIEPLVTVLVAALWINETISAASLIGGGIVILGVYLVNRR
ncbi:MAG: DMT family transporter [Anaerolineae bacterium]|nr:DMT family transporter [Anaerolineae bacterium]